MHDAKKRRAQELSAKLARGEQWTQEEKDEAAALAARRAAEGILEAMNHSGLPPNSVTYSVMIGIAVAALMELREPERKSAAGFLRELAESLERGPEERAGELSRAERVALSAGRVGRA